MGLREGGEAGPGEKGGLTSWSGESGPCRAQVSQNMVSFAQGSTGRISLGLLGAR